MIDSLELIAKGLSGELMLVPKDKLGAVLVVLESVESNLVSGHKTSKQAMNRKNLSDDPWLPQLSGYFQNVV